MSDKILELEFNQDLIDDFLGKEHWRMAPGNYWYSYHNDWNMLMIVVEKINSVGYDVDIFSDGIDGSHECVIHDTGNVYQCIEDSKSLIDAVYKAVVEFIRWHNSQPHKL